ncbi:hypothetical protein [Nocardia blacklockiae]|uniref:hypothetical protein n=1 Tax=Nocardia blacklockiae TaxID=480036 RepID=UPI00189341E2|nr:hypothetical protein [Nocardia blacklockiae]MBF6176025.1 hypothetical protein [Nocardia blacklockiae]
MSEDTTTTHVTECDGLEASWTLIWRGAEIEGIAVTGVYDTADDLPVVSIGQAPYPDLAEARRRWPRLTDLWDAVRHDFWHPR